MNAKSNKIHISRFNSRAGLSGSLLCLLACGIQLFIACKLAAATNPLSWEWSNPTPHGNNIIDVAFTNGSWIQVAERGQIYTSSNLLHWTRQPGHTTNALRSITTFKNLVLISGENGVILSGPSPSELGLIQLATSDWLEGITASPQVAVAVGDNSAIYTSSDGRDWQRQAPPFNAWLRSVTYGTPGGIGTFVAVGEAGFVATSSDGSLWQARPRLGSQDLNKVSWFNGEFWIAGDSGVLFQSSSATAWQTVNTGASRNLNAFAGSAAARLVAGDSEVRLKPGFLSWMNELDPLKPAPPPAWTYLSAISLAPDRFLLCGRSGMMVEGNLLTSNLAAWIEFSDSPRNWLWDVKRFPELYLAVGDRATILSSLEGMVWDTEVPPLPGTDSVFLGIGGRTNLAVAVGSAGTIIISPDQKQTIITTNPDGTLVTNQISTLGIAWDAIQPPPANVDLQGVTSFGNLVVVSGGSGTILTSPDGRLWTRRATPTTSFLSSLESFPGGLVAVGRNGTILTSPDALTWTQRVSRTTNWIYKVRFAGDRLVAVGQNGTILTSLDGAAWTPQLSRTSNWLNDVQFVNNNYYAIGNQGTVLSSSNAVDWSHQGTITGKSLFGAAHHNGLLVLVGVEGAILRAQTSPSSTPVYFLQFPTRPDQSTFSFSGQPGQKFTLDRSSDIINWATGPLIEIGSSGTLLYQDTRPNSTPHQFFRAKPTP
jgi:hypothetical protein